MRTWRTALLIRLFSICFLFSYLQHAHAQQDQSLGDVARRLHQDKAEQGRQTAPPEWLTAQPQANHEPISDIQLVGWVAGGVPSEDLVAELHNRGVAFLPSDELNELLRQAGASSSILDEVSKAERHASTGSSPDEMAALSKVVADMQQQNDRLSFRELVALVKTDSRNPGLYILLGHMLEKQEAWEGMIAAFVAAIQLDRDFAYSHGRLAMACYQAQQGCAKTEAEAMLALQPKSADGHKLLGLAYMGMRNAPLALVEYQKALSLGPKQPELVYYDMGLAREMAHDADGAIAAYRHAIALNPEEWRAFNALGEVYVRQGRIDEGVLNLRKAKAAAPDRLDIRQNLGAALCNSGRNADAIAEFEELLQLDPDWNMARRCLAKSLRAVGRLDEAQKVQDEYQRRETEQ